MGSGLLNMGLRWVGSGLDMDFRWMGSGYLDMDLGCGFQDKVSASWNCGPLDTKMARGACQDKDVCWGDALDGYRDKSLGVSLD